VKDSVLKSSWIALDRRLNSPLGFRVLLSVFLLVAIVFSAVPLLHYFRGRSIMDYKLWYDTGKHVLAGDEIFFLHNGKYDFMYPTPCAIFLAGASLLGQAGLILFLVAINSASWWPPASESCVALRRSNYYRQTKSRETEQRWRQFALREARYFRPRLTWK